MFGWVTKSPNILKNDDKLSIQNSSKFVICSKIGSKFDRVFDYKYIAVSPPKPKKNWAWWYYRVFWPLILSISYKALPGCREDEAIRSWRQSLCCETISEERSAVNPHATFCENRRWVITFDDPAQDSTGGEIPTFYPTQKYTRYW